VMPRACETRCEDFVLVAMRRRVLFQVVVNLVGNAIRLHQARRGVVVARGSRPDRSWRSRWRTPGSGSRGPSCRTSSSRTPGARRSRRARASGSRSCAASRRRTADASPSSRKKERGAGSPCFLPRA
jgi:hypothetical protein